MVQLLPAALQGTLPGWMRKMPLFQEENVGGSVCGVQLKLLFAVTGGESKVGFVARTKQQNFSNYTCL